MAYEKQQWNTTSYVNPTRMNHIENGIQENSENIDTLTQGASDMSTEISGIKQNIADLGVPELLYNSGTDITDSTQGTVSDISKYKAILITNDYYSNILFSEVVFPNLIINKPIVIRAIALAGNNGLEFVIKFTSNTDFEISSYTTKGGWNVYKLLIYGIK